MHNERRDIETTEKSLLIIEDEVGIASALAAVAERCGLSCEVAASAELGLDLFVKARPSFVVLDIGLPDGSGLDVLSEIRARDERVPVVIITAHGELQNALAAKKRGASAYVVKPIDLDDFERLIGDLSQAMEVEDAPDTGGLAVVEAAEEDPSRAAPFLIGSSAAMQPAFASIAHACASDVSVLITGPTGIGKSLAARVIHANSARHSGPFVVLACSSLPETLLEAELFGHEAGAFTGATKARAGHLERAQGGTLLLDEIGELSLAVQVKLLRFLDERSFAPVGGREDKQADIRVLAATNRDLDRDVADGRFREDLLYRLRVLELKLPPLASRIEDLPALCSHLLSRVGGRGRVLSPGVLEILERHDWPGNVRELRNVLEHASAVCSGTTILRGHLPQGLRDAAAAAGGVAGGVAGGLGDGADPGTGDEDLLDAALEAWLDALLASDASYAEIHRRIEQRILAALLPRYDGMPTRLARALGMNRATLRKKLRGEMDTAPDDGA